ncbi:hypothetical protein [Streptomyces sp. NPDC051567]|uniref:hypothetical protein n=1 Tax=Streptomyces sp. NPDC051567 TaxID=3365660 RepID=UPI0037B37C3C
MTGTTLTPLRTTSAPRTGPVRAVLRLHRTSFWIWTAYVVTTAAVLLWMLGPGGTGALREITDCARSKSCGSHPAVSAYKDGLLAAKWLILAPSYLLPAYAGAALVGRELETGTAQLAWTQNVSPARWLATKLAVAAGLIVFGMTVLVVLFRMVRDARFGTGIWSLYDHFVYHDAGLLAVAYPLLGLALGALAGIALRQAVPALAAATAAIAVLSYVYSLVRFELWPSVTVTTTSDTFPGGMALSTQVITGDGTRLPYEAFTNRFSSHPGSGTFVHEYQPYSHFWPLQLVETGTLLALATLATLAAFHLLRRRTP